MHDSSLLALRGEVLLQEAFAGFVGGDAAVGVAYEDDILACIGGFGDSVADGGDIFVEVREALVVPAGGEVDEIGLVPVEFEGFGKGCIAVCCVPGAWDEQDRGI